MFSPLAHVYRWEGEDFWAKHKGLKQGAIGNTLGEHNGNLGNLMGTRWEQLEKNEKNPPTKEKKKKKFKKFKICLALPFPCPSSFGGWSLLSIIRQSFFHRPKVPAMFMDVMFAIVFCMDEESIPAFELFLIQTHSTAMVFYLKAFAMALKPFLTFHQLLVFTPKKPPPKKKLKFSYITF